MDFEIEPKIIGLTLFFWMICTIAIWKLSIMGDGFPTWQKWTLTILMLPIIFLIMQWQNNKG